MKRIYRIRRTGEGVRREVILIIVLKMIVSTGQDQLKLIKRGKFKLGESSRVQQVDAILGEEGIDPVVIGIVTLLIPVHSDEFRHKLAGAAIDTYPAHQPGIHP